MSKKKVVSKGKATVTPQNANQGRRKFIFAGVGTLAAAAVGAGGYSAGWFSSSTAQVGAVTPTPPTAVAALKPLSLSPDLPNAIRACDELVRHYTHALDNPYTLIHAVRAFGKNFTRADGSNAVDYLCSKFAEEREVNGKRYVHFQREAEFHENSFLKTLLEAGVSHEHPVTVGSTQYKLSDICESIKSLFRLDLNDFNRFEKNYVGEHLPWGLIAFSILVPPTKATWTNAWGEAVNLNEVIDKTLAGYEHSCETMHQAQARNEFVDDASRKAFDDSYTCLGGHALYGYVSLVRHGYRENKLKERVGELLDLATYRLRKEPEAIDREYLATAAAPFPPQLANDLARFGATQQSFTEMARLRQQIKLIGHLLESVNLVRLLKLYNFTPEQLRNIQAGEQKLYESMVKLRSLDLEPIYRWRNKQINDLVIALGHAGRAMKLLTPQNPDGEEMRA